MSQKEYNASSIEVIENLEAVRKRPGMYIGDTSLRGLHHLFKEIVDNSVDEHLANHCSKINVILNSNNSISVEDNGRGIPIDIHPKTGKPAIETIFTTLHSGGKFGGENSGYAMAGGLHGVGSSVVNALSEYLNVRVFKNKMEYSIKFGNGGKLIEGLKEIGPTTKKSGTLIEFRPDSKIFSSISFNGHTIANRLKEIAYLNPGLEINYEDKKNEEKYEFKYENGLVTFVDDLSKEQKEISKATYIESESSKKDFIIKIAFKYCSSIQDNIHSFVNNIQTPGGGTHEVSFKSSLTKAINEFAKVNKLDEKEQSLDGDDIREGLVAVVSLYVLEKHLQFEGQTKDKLSSVEIKSELDKIIFQLISHYLNKNRIDATNIIKKAYESKRAREAAKKAREISKELSKSSKKSFVGKLVVAQSNKPQDRELFIVEGDSAGGSAKLGRDRKTQAILPLKGKIINTERASLKSIVANEELMMLIHSIGTGIDNSFNIKDCNYGKVIIMTDADTDGAHIQTLLLTFFFRFMKPLVDNGMIYIALPPLFKVTNKKDKKITYLWTDEELAKIKVNNSNLEIQRYKGLGEMNYEQLWETTMDPKTRSLIKVDSTNFEQIDKIIDILMGQDAEIRREWIDSNVEFSLEDFQAKFVEYAEEKTKEISLKNGAENE